MGQASIFFTLASGWVTASGWTVYEPVGQRGSGWAFRFATPAGWVAQDLWAPDDEVRHPFLPSAGSTPRQ